MRTKEFTATIEQKGNLVSSAIFKANNLKEAKAFAQMWKRREGYKGSVYVRLLPELDKN